MISRQPLIKQETKDIVLFDNVFLLSDNKQLRLKFDSNITSYKHNQTQRRTDLIGNKYPFIEKTSANNYKSFTIGGKIISLSDVVEDESEYANKNREFDFLQRKNTFVTSNELYKNNNIMSLYNNLNKKRTSVYDYVFEREYRNYVIDFLFNNEAFLLRSLTEGNVIVKLTNIEFKPESELSNYIYSFSATATEIAECSLMNLYKYNIITNYTSLRARLISQAEYIDTENLEKVLIMYQNPNNILDIKLDYQYITNSDSLKNSELHSEEKETEQNLTFLYLSEEDELDKVNEDEGNIIFEQKEIL